MTTCALIRLRDHIGHAILDVLDRLAVETWQDTWQWNALHIEKDACQEK